MKFLEESVAECLRFYGDGILSAEAKKDAFGRFGFNIYQLACEKYIFNQSEHPVKKEWKEEVEKYRDQNDGIATSKTRLTW